MKTFRVPFVLSAVVIGFDKCRCAFSFRKHFDLMWITITLNTLYVCRNVFHSCETNISLGAKQFHCVNTIGMWFNVFAFCVNKISNCFCSLLSLENTAINIMRENVYGFQYNALVCVLVVHASVYVKNDIDYLQQLK